MLDHPEDPVENGVRPDITNAEQNFHMDNSYNICAPDYVGAPVSAARERRQSEPHRELLHRVQPDDRALSASARTLFRLYLFDRQREHAPGDPAIISHPLLQNEGERMVCRLSHRHVIVGYGMAQRDMHAETPDALQTLGAVMREPQWAREFCFEPGQIQIVDNLRCGHSRTQFGDFEEEDRKRHLARL